MWRWIVLVLLIAPACGASAAPPPNVGGDVPSVPASSDKPAEVAPPPPPVKIIVAGETPPETTEGAPVVATSDDSDTDTDDEDPDDEHDDEEEATDATPTPAPTVLAARPAPATSPLLKLTVAELEARYKKDPASVGPLALGTPNAGALVNGVQMPKSDKWIVQDPSCAWGTQETIDGIVKSIEKVFAEHPGAPPLAIGHISTKRGGYLSPHKSHQSGRDVDLGYYHAPPKSVFVRASENNLDLERTWALVKVIVTETDTDLVLIDTGIQRILAKYALSHGEDEAFVDQVFQVRNKHPRPLVRHARGHANHLHVRFSSHVAQQLGRRAEAFLKREKIAPPHVEPNYIMHKARNGDTLVNLAKHYATTVEAIQAANGLKTIDLKIGRTYKIPAPKSLTPKQTTHSKHSTQAKQSTPAKAAPKGKPTPPKTPTKPTSKTNTTRRK